MILPSLISLRRPAEQPLAPEDVFGSSLGGIFTDDLQNQHGDDPNTVIEYRSVRGLLEFRTADVNGEEQRRKFAHYLWNAGILMAELVGQRSEHESNKAHDGTSLSRPDDDDEWKNGEWWTDEEEEKNWGVEGHKVLELGAGVGLGGIMSMLSGADEVAITDYPAPPILDAIKTNVFKNLPERLRSRTIVHGHLWGDFTSDFATANAQRYTRILAADCLWMPYEHDNLAKSMDYFLADSPDARILCIAGFHTGRAKMVPFLEEAIPQHRLEVEEIYEMNANGLRRPWATERDGGREDIGERKKWLVVARIRRQGVE